MQKELATKEKHIIEGIEIKGSITSEYLEILTKDAIKFLSKLSNKFENQRKELLKLRQKKQEELNTGLELSFLKETEKIRESNWKVANIPKDLENRKVEITGPVDRKMIINALNSGANVFMADFEDSNSPTWANNIQGQINLRDAINKTIFYESSEGKKYKLNEKIATLFVRPRGLHLNEKHIIINGEEISASLFDFGLYFFHNVHNLLKNNTGPYLYIPKLESHLEARFWNDVFNFAQDELNIKRGIIRATVLIETIMASFEMDEILYELREHSAGLNCGRWDYIFSFIKKFRNKKEFVLPDREQVTMDKHFLNSYVQLLIKTCHKRGIHAMGGMAAQIPIKNDEEANKIAIEKVRNDKLREVKAGHDGTWVAHPGLVSIAKEIFDSNINTSNQIQKQLNINITPKDLITIPEGKITEAGLRKNINVGLLYIESWLRGIGCVPIYNLMEDAATAEICRTQVWQWIHHKVKMSNGDTIDEKSVTKYINKETEKIKTEFAKTTLSIEKLNLAAQLFKDMVTNNNFIEFLTLKAYNYID